MKADRRLFRRLIALHLSGYKVSAIRILGRKVMTPLGPLKLYTLPVEASLPQTQEVFDTISSSHPSGTPYPILIHCTHGKDRTGLIVTLILMLLGIDWEIIEKDYFLSDGELEADKAERQRELAEKGLGKEFVNCSEGFVPRVVDMMDERGGIEKWLVDVVGVESVKLGRMKRALLMRD